ncbi:mucoidy inhibitor MuiA family protein [Flavobacteriaceae bacterium R38]|nr:mucoidy inhibitor MuiA family protein [Flavobacteriaceae bacterium R38]
MSNIDQSQIKTIETLKSAAATAIYGSKASSGAVIITTKTVIEEENLTSKEFEIKKRYSIPSVNDVTAITINDFEVKANFEYFAAPLLNENVFLTAKLAAWEQFNLLPGEANIYFDGSYAGKTFIDPFQTKKELTISLGIEPNIVVERKQVNDLKSTQFIGNNRIVNKAYELNIKNNQAKNIPLLVMDRIPISQNKEIKIDDIIYNDADYDDKKRLLTWKINISSQETINKSFSYKIKYPKGKRINL